MVKSTQERLWLIGGSASAFLMILIGYFFLISPERSTTQTVRDQISAARVQTESLQKRIDQLTVQNKDLDRFRNKVAVLKLALPSTSGLPDFLRSLQALGNASLTDVTSLTVGPPKDVVPAAPAGETPAAPSATASSTAPPAGTVPAAGAAVEGHVYALAITAQVSGSTSRLNEFLDQLQSVQPRAVLITAITVGTTGVGGGAPTSGATGTTMQLTMQAFVAPASSAPAVPLAQAAPSK
jgi:type IV pilus assembly protein PilO